MKLLPLFSSVLALNLTIGTPGVLAHVGHGDEFQATGGVNRVEVNAETDPLLGIQVNPIEPATDGSSAVLIPVTALVDDNGRQLVFVQYENFYEPVDVILGETQGDLIAVTEGLSVGEQLVTQGSLNLYAESRKTQTAEEATAEAEAATTAVETIEESVAEMEEPVEEPAEAAQESGGGFSMGLLAAVGGGAALLLGAVVVMGGKKKSS